MEKQKVFWVVLAVSVFVVVVLIVGVLLLRQHPAGAPRATVTPMNDSGTQVYEYQRETPLTPPGGTQGAPGTQGAQPGAGTSGTQPGGQPGTQPGTGDQQTMHFYIGEGAPSASGTAPGASSVPSAPTSPTTPAPSVTVPSTPAAPPAVSSAPTTIRPRSTRPAATAAAPKKTTQYWIQAGAYKSQDKADELVKLLEGKGISSRVFSYASKGDTWYRVRVGPYSNRGEAGKFLSLVKQVQGLEASYIALVSASRSSVN